MRDVDLPADPERLLEHQDAMRRLACHLLRDAADAEDAAQDANLAALRGRGRIRHDFGAWLRGTVRHAAYHVMRSRRRQRRREERASRPELTPATADVVARIEIRRRVLDALERVAEPFRTTLVLRYIDDLEPRQIARRLGVPVATIYSRQKRGLARMRALLGADDVEGRPSWSLGLAALVAPPRPGAEGILELIAVKKTAVVASLALCIVLGLILLDPLGFLDAHPSPEQRGAGDIALAVGGPASEPAEAPQDATPALTASTPHAADASPAAPVDAPWKAGALAGRVRDTHTDEPLAGVRVLLLRPVGVWDAPTPHLETRTDSEGRYAFSRIEPGRWVLCAESRTHFMPQTRLIPQRKTPEGTTYFGPPDELVVVMPPSGPALEREIRMEQGHAIRGRVVDTHDEPLEGVSIFARNNLTRVASHWGVGVPGGARAAAVTDASGRFTVTGLLPLSGRTILPGPRGARGTLTNGWRLRAEKAGFAPVLTTPVPVGPGVTTPAVRITLSAAGALVGRVRHGERSIANAWLRWHRAGEGGARPGTAPPPGGPTWRVQADGQGAFRISGIPAREDGLVSVRGTGAPAFTLPVPPLQPGELRTLDIELPAGARLRGRLVSEAGQPCPGRRVLLRPTSGAPATRVLTTTDDRGVFVFSGLPESGAGDLLVEVEPTHTVRVAASVPFGAPPQDHVLRLQVLRMRILDDDGHRIPLCRVLIDTAGAERPPSFFLRPRDPALVVNGRVERIVYGPGPYTIRITQPRDEERRPLNLKPHAVAFDAIPEDELAVRLVPGGEVTGRVLTMETAPVEGATVTCAGTEVATDAEGAFALGGLEQGTVRIEVAPPAGFARPDPIEAAVGGPLLTIHLHREARVGGILVDEQGRPLGQGTVTASWVSEKGVTVRRTGKVRPDGRWTVLPVPADATLTLRATNWAPGVAEMRPPVVVEDVAPGTDDLRLVLARGFPIEGRVLGPDGGLLTNVSVVARVPGPGGEQAGAADPDATGRFRLFVAKPGPYELAAFRGRRLTPPLGVEAPSRGIELRVPPTRTLAGRIVGGGTRRFIVRAWPVGAPGKAGPWQHVGGDGRFAITLRGRAERYVIGGRSVGKKDVQIVCSDPVLAGTDDARLEPRSASAIVLAVSWGGAEAGAPASDPLPKVQYVARGSHWTATGFRVPEADGRLVLDGLLPGTYEVQVRRLGASAWTALGSIAAGSKPCEVELPRRP